MLASTAWRLCQMIVRILDGGTMKIILDVHLSSFGINIDVQPDNVIDDMDGSEQQAIAEEAIRALQHFIIMITSDQEGA